MANKNFTQFNLKTPLLTSDFIVGYRADGSAEFRSQIKDIVTLVPDSDKQTLSFNTVNNNLTISSGNTVSLSSLADTAFINLSSSFVQSNNSVKTIISLTQVEYDAIPVKDPLTVYIIV